MNGAEAIYSTGGENMQSETLIVKCVCQHCRRVTVVPQETIESALSAAEPAAWVYAPDLAKGYGGFGKEKGSVLMSLDGEWINVDTPLYAAPPASSVAVKALDVNRPLPYDRDTLGRFVREAWVRWAKTQPEPKPSWLLPYDELSEADKEADRQIGEAIARWTLVGDAARYAKIKEHLDNIEATADAISSPYRNSIIRKNALSALSALSAQAQDVTEIIETVEECVLFSTPGEYAGLADHAAFEAGQDNAIKTVVKLLKDMLPAAPAKQE